jgi:hypothetical protein
MNLVNVFVRKCDIMETDIQIQILDLSISVYIQITLARSSVAEWRITT